MRHALFIFMILTLGCAAETGATSAEDELHAGEPADAHDASVRDPCTW